MALWRILRLKSEGLVYVLATAAGTDSRDSRDHMQDTDTGYRIQDTGYTTHRDAMLCDAMRSRDKSGRGWMGGWVDDGWSLRKV